MKIVDQRLTLEKARAWIAAANLSLSRSADELHSAWEELTLLTGTEAGTAIGTASVRVEEIEASIRRLLQDLRAIKR